MNREGKPITILMADDDADDRQMTLEAFNESRLANDLRFVEDGAELMDYLYRRNKYAGPNPFAAPWLAPARFEHAQEGTVAKRSVRSRPIQNFAAFASW